MCPRVPANSTCSCRTPGWLLAEISHAPRRGANSAFRRSPCGSGERKSRGGKGGGKGGGKAGAKKEDAKEENNGGIYRSDDKGKTWTHVSSFYPSAEIGFYFGQIRVDPNEDQRVYVLAVQMHVSTDGGKTFGNLGSGHADNHALWINPKNSERVVLGLDLKKA